MKLLVGSVFLDHPRADTWYRLQLKFLRRTTTDFDHVVFLNGHANVYNESRVIADPSPTSIAQDGHVRGLNAIVQHFKQGDYDTLLLLDNDAFPIRCGWQSALLDAMGDHQVAAVMRYENLDTFAHPSAFFATRSAAERLVFGYFNQVNILGIPFRDTSSNVTSFFPLVRTNYKNPHPILCGIYGDTCYHHGAGSRSVDFRLFGCGYLKEKPHVEQLERRLFASLVDDPFGFVGSLRPAVLQVQDS